jgi:hypothetical protein
LTSKWAPIVYGRTLDVDFRFIAVPTDFDQAWVQPFVLATMTIAEKLTGGPRWALFQNERTRVVGVTCMARDLVSREDPMIKDVQGRPLYLFAGYAAPRAQGTGPQVPLPDGARSLSAFAPLYDYVREQWTVKSARPPRKVDPTDVSFPSMAQASRQESVAGQRINLDSWQRALWPDTPDSRLQLWEAISGATRPVSVCLGLARQRDVIDGPFLNATALDTPGPVVLPARTSAPSTTAVLPTVTASAGASGRYPSPGLAESPRQSAGPALPQAIILYGMRLDDRWEREFINEMTLVSRYPVELAGRGGDFSPSPGAAQGRWTGSELVLVFPPQNPPLLVYRNWQEAREYLRGVSNPGVNEFDVMTFDAMSLDGRQAAQVMWRELNRASKSGGSKGLLGVAGSAWRALTSGHPDDDRDF